MGRQQQQVRVGHARRLVVATVLGIGLATAAAACTSSGATTAPGPSVTSAPVTSAPDPSAPGTTAAHTTGTSRPSATTTTEGGSSSTTTDPNELTPASIVVHAVPGQEGYCGSIATAMQDLSTAALMALGGGDSHYADQALKDVQALYRQLAEDAPSEIRADVQTLSDKLDAITDASKLQDLNEDPAALAAGERFTSWIKTNCGFDPNNPSG